jgi:hypothetical protein
MALQQITKDTDNHLKILIYGQAGVGKTSLLRTFPPEAKVCTVSAESGLLSVRDLVQAGKVTGVVINTLDDFLECLEQFKSNSGLKEKYDWIFIDSLTEIATQCYAVYREKYPNNKYGLWDDFNFSTEMIIKSFRDLKDYNVIFTCLEIFATNEAQQVIPLPDMPGKVLKQKILSIFDEVFYMTTNNDSNDNFKRIFYTRPYFNYKAKDRSGKLDYIEDANIEYLYHKIFS